MYGPNLSYIYFKIYSKAKEVSRPMAIEEMGLAAPLTMGSYDHLLIQEILVKKQ